MTRQIGMWSLIVVASMLLLTARCAQKSTTASGAGTQIGASGPSAEEIRAREEEERPGDPGHGEEAWSRNRRVEFKAM